MWDCDPQDCGSGMLVPAHLSFKDQRWLVGTSLFRWPRHEVVGKVLSSPCSGDNKEDSVSFIYQHLQRHLKNHLIHLSTHHFACHPLDAGTVPDVGIERPIICHLLPGALDLLRKIWGCLRHSSWYFCSSYSCQTWPISVRIDCPSSTLPLWCHWLKTKSTSCFIGK